MKGVDGLEDCVISCQENRGGTGVDGDDEIKTEIAVSLAATDGARRGDVLSLRDWLREGSGTMELAGGMQIASGRNSQPVSRAHALSDAGFYVPEIDGLRAVAVGTVMLYRPNFHSSLMSGGFIGVVVF